MTTSLYRLDGSHLAACQDWEGAQKCAAYHWGCPYDAVDAVESIADDGDCITWLVIDGRIVGTVGRPDSASVTLEGASS
jgi:hypothetical protein